MSKFKDFYSRLNPEQKKAVDTIDGPVMVIAGPGTGKTQVLTARIGNILLKTDTPPYSILALTFTDSAAKTMRDRLVSLIGKDGYYVNITTFHSFCAQIIRNHSEYFPIERDSQPLENLERYSLLEEIIDKLPLKKLRPLNKPTYYLKDIISSISKLKREAVTPEEYQKIIEKEYVINDDMKKVEKDRITRDKEKNQDLALLYIEYQKELVRRKRYDFDDMISMVVDAFKKDEILLREYQEKYLYFLVDEYQDTNTSQNSVVQLLANYWGDNANIFVVGDPHQSIYRFQGASLENTISFIGTYPKAQIITLETGYRCHQLVYDAAHALISHNTLTQDPRYELLLKAINKKLISSHNEKTDNNHIDITSYPSQIVETAEIARTIKELITSGVKPEEITILYKRNSETELVQELLDKEGIAYEVESGANIFRDEAIRQLIQCMRLLEELKKGSENELIFEVMSYEWTDLPPVVGFELSRNAYKKKKSMYDIVRDGHSKESFLTPLEFEMAGQFIRRLEEWVIDSGRMVFTEWFEKLINDSGYLDWVLKQENRIEILNDINSLFRFIKSLVNKNHGMRLSEFLSQLDILEQYGIEILSEDLNIKTGAVHLSTVHKAKGGEWEHVFIIHCVDKKWGNESSVEKISLPTLLLPHTDISKKERNEDDRRLFYVAITRSKTQVYVSYPETTIDENKSRDVIESMFIDELPAKSIHRLQSSISAESAEELLTNLLRTETSPYIGHDREKEFFRNLIKNFSLSTTLLTKYLKDPRAFALEGLIRVPMAKKEHLAFGTSVHSALEYLYKEKKNGNLINLNQFLTAYENKLKEELIHIDDLTRRIAYGKEVLTKYYENNKEASPEVLFLERFFGSYLSKTVLDNDIQLNGRIDRIDWIDRDGKLVKVIDYKTGKAKSANEIEGRTQSADLSARELTLPVGIRGQYKRQLVFYKLLAELDPTFVPEVAFGEFEFIEPNDSGKFVTRSFQLHQEDVSDLKDVIREVVHEIRELKFLEYL